MRLAVLRDAIGKAAETPGLRLGDLPAIVFDDLGGVFRERIDLGLCKVLAREENMLVERHVSLLSFGRSLTPPSAAPLRLSSKKHWGTSKLAPHRRRLWPMGREKASETMNFAGSGHHLPMNLFSSGTRCASAPFYARKE